MDRLAYLAEMAQAQLEGVRHLVLVDARSPVSFFAYPDKASDLVPPGCTVHVLARPGEDAAGALEALAEAVAAPGNGGVPAPAGRPERPAGRPHDRDGGRRRGRHLPEGTIVVDEGNTSGLFVSAATAGAPRHDWLTLTGGAIGIGLPMATGAAVAAPERPVLCLQADGSAMYTLQALWTQAREGLNVTTVLLSNRSYAIFNMELHRVGADAGGPLARRLLDLTDPELDFCDLARGMGVPARRVENAEDLVTALETGSPRRSNAHRGAALMILHVVPAAVNGRTTVAMRRQQTGPPPNRFQRLYSARKGPVTMQ